MATPGAKALPATPRSPSALRQILLVYTFIVLEAGVHYQRGGLPTKPTPSKGTGRSAGMHLACCPSC